MEEDDKGLFSVNVLEQFNFVKTPMLEVGMFDNLVHDDNTVEDIVNSLATNYEVLFQISYEHEFGGMFTVEDLGTICGKRTVEIHAFIMPHLRKYSQDFLLVFANFIFNNTGFEVIVTSVPEHCFKVGKFLKRIGFQEIGHVTDQYKINGELLGVTHFALQK